MVSTTPNQTKITHNSNRIWEEAADEMADIIRDKQNDIAKGVLVDFITDHVGNAAADIAIETALKGPTDVLVGAASDQLADAGCEVAANAIDFVADSHWACKLVFAGVKAAAKAANNRQHVMDKDSEIMMANTLTTIH